VTEAQKAIVAQRAAGIATEIVEHPDKPGWFALAASDEQPRIRFMNFDDKQLTSSIGDARGSFNTESAGSLLPCPFCGGRAQICGEPDYADRHGLYVECQSADCWCSMGEFWDCDAMPDHYFRDVESAVAAWNRRANVKGEG